MSESSLQILFANGTCLGILKIRKRIRNIKYYLMQIIKRNLIRKISGHLKRSWRFTCHFYIEKVSQREVTRNKNVKSWRTPGEDRS